MQWLRVDASSRAMRNRIDTLDYGVGYVREAGPGHGAIVDSAAQWVGERLHHVPAPQRTPLARLLHDTHPMEQEAESHAQEFLRLTGGAAADAGSFDAGR
jgi:hypothetical protein